MRLRAGNYACQVTDSGERQPRKWLTKNGFEGNVLLHQALMLELLYTACDQPWE